MRGFHALGNGLRLDAGDFFIRIHQGCCRNQAGNGFGAGQGMVKYRGAFQAKSFGIVF